MVLIDIPVPVFTIILTEISLTV